MLGECKNEKSLHAKLSEWRNLKDTQVLIHTINPAYENSSPLFLKDACSVFRQWDVLSSSLIDLDKIKHVRDKMENLRSWEELRRDTGIFFEIGFVLDFAPQNILGTFAEDVWFPNHAGINNRNTYALTDAILSGKGKPGGRHAWPGENGHSYNEINSPKYILNRSDLQRHNEILVVCKPFINIYPGLPPTEPLKIKKIIYAPKRVTGHPLFRSMERKAKKRVINKLAALNPGVPMTEI
ncbi:hypothetical protein SAMN05192562_105178 [Kosakonia arachidis]|uniref:Uncharacterized protein n=1 Tax=Kosakonia arachidis TaxID=551989 RepID=A0A1I7DJH0_9ENTR|nr:hypothetical protein [Kosakonia arachidis]SFU11852.1 hypothetical protein SAMN05192562_105178 [Kosakonia arachidis]